MLLCGERWHERLDSEFEGGGDWPPRDAGVAVCHLRCVRQRERDMQTVDVARWTGSLVASLKIPTADEDRGLGTGKVDGGAVFVITKAFTETRKLLFNVGYTVVGSVSEVQLQDQLFFGLAGETSIPSLAEERLQFVAEVFGTTAEEKGGPGDIQGHLGVRYRVGEDLILDAAIGRSFTSPPPVEFFATVGFTWTFDAPWKCRNR